MAYQTSILCYAQDGSIAVGSSYSEMQNLWIKLAPTGSNGLMSINSFYKDGKNKKEPTTLWYMAGEEWISPIKFSADSGSGETVLTGGDRTFADGTPTAMTESVAVTLDGEKVQKGTTATGSVIEITVENKIRAGNDKAGDWAIAETVVYTIHSNIISAEVTLKALRNGRIIEYNGAQTKLYDDYNMSTLTFKGGRKNAYADSDYYKYNSGLKADYPNVRSFYLTSKNGYADKLEVWVTNYGLGRMTYLTDKQMPVITVDGDKVAAFHLVAPVADTQSKEYQTCRMYKGGKAFFNVKYEFTYTEGDMSEFLNPRLSNITSVSATLTTNMVIDTSTAALKIGESYVNVTESDTEKTYLLSYAEPIENGNYTLTGSVNVPSYDTTVQIRRAFKCNVAFEYGLSHATENVMLMTTNLPVDTESAEIMIGNESCTIEKLANELNKYAVRPETPLIPGRKYDVVIKKLQAVGGTDLVRLETKSVTAQKGVTKITGAEMIINDNGTKAARLTGTNNVVGYSPVVLAAAYTDESMLCSVDYKILLLPYSGEFPKDLDSSWLWVDGDAESIRTYVFDSLDNLLPL